MSAGIVAALAGIGVAGAIITALIFRSRATYRRLGEAEHERDLLRAANKDYEQAVEVLLAPVPTLADLERVSDPDAG